MLLADKHNPRALAMAEKLEGLLPDGLALPSDFFVVLGGDGFQLPQQFHF